MTVHEDPDDLIETVTAEIEAIIQEEINSQNVETTPADESEHVQLDENHLKASEIENFQAAAENITNVTESIQTIPIELENVQAVLNQTESVKFPAKISENIHSKPETFAASEDSEIDTALKEVLLKEPILNENQIETEITSISVTFAETKAEKEKEKFTEYTVEVSDSVSEEKKEILVENVETILNDAPIDENDGPRAKHFKQALRKALNNTVKSCSGDKLEACFPFNLKANQFAQINSTIIHALKSVIDGVQVPFDEFLKTQNLIDKLNKVDEFTRSRIPGASEVSLNSVIVSSLTPQNLIDRKLYTTKLATISKLEEFNTALEFENSQLLSKLNNCQTEFADRLDRLKSSQQLLDAALDQISTISMEDLEVLVDKMNYQYQPSALKFHD